MAMIRLYGPSIGNSSFARVASGMRGALSELGLLAGFVPIDAYDEETIYLGHDAEVGLYVGPPHGVGMLSGIGWHKKRLAFLVANSTWIPDDVLLYMEQHVTSFVVPSGWASGILRKYTKLDVSVWQHGVAPEFAPDSRDYDKLRLSHPSGHFEVAHLSSTTMQRKSTRELVRAWSTAVHDHLIGHDARLRIVINVPDGFYRADLEATSHGDPAVYKSIIWLPSMNLDPADASALYRKHHLIIQPSRGEGFGLCPLEARASGVVVAMTHVTGHREHYDIETDHGVVLVRSGEDEPIDDGPEAIAPCVTQQNILDGLVESYRNWQTYAWHAQQDAERVRLSWSWLRTTKDWIQHGGVL